MSYTRRRSDHGVAEAFSWSNTGSESDISRYLVVVGDTLYHLTDGNTYHHRGLSGGWQEESYDEIGVDAANHNLRALLEVSDGAVVFFANGQCTKITNVGYEVQDYVLPTNLIHATGVEVSGKYYLAGIEYEDDGLTTTFTPRAYVMADPDSDTEFTEITLQESWVGTPCFPFIRKAGAGDDVMFSVYGYDGGDEEYTLFVQDISNDTLGSSVTVPNDAVTKKICKPKEVANHIVYAGTNGIVTYNPDVSSVPVTRDTSAALSAVTALGDYGVAGTVGAYCGSTVIYSSDGTTWNSYTSP